MPNLLDEKLSRFEELERQLVDPEVLANPAPHDRRDARARLAGASWPRSIAASRFSTTKSATPWRWSRAPTPTARTGRGRTARNSRPSEKPLERTARHDHRRRRRQPHAVHRGDPRRHRRRRGRAVRPRPLRNVQALRRGQALEGGSARHVADRVGRLQGDHFGPRRRRGLSAGCNSRAAAIASSACPKPRPRAASTPRPPPWPSWPSPRTSKST